MGQGLSCRVKDEHWLFTAVQSGDLETVRSVLERDPDLIQQTTVNDRHSALHIAAANGQIEVRSLTSLGFSVRNLALPQILLLYLIDSIDWCFKFCIFDSYFIWVFFQILSMLLENRSVNPDSLNRHKQVCYFISFSFSSIDLKFL